MSEFASLGVAFQQNGFLTLPGYLAPASLVAVQESLKDLDRGMFVGGDDSEHAWKEYHNTNISYLHEIVDVDRLEDMIQCRISKSYLWINWYEPGSYISGHRDAGGMLQLLIPIIIPSCGDGGELWIGECGNVVPIHEGDGFLFLASELIHGTTEVSRLSKRPRITINARLWF